MHKATVRLLDGMTFNGSASSGHSLVMDADEAVGGRNKGFRPMELLLVAFGGCTGMDVISILRKKRQAVSGLEMHITGEQRDAFPHIYAKVHVEYVVTGRGVQKEAVERSIELSLTKYCSVGATLAAAGKITHSYRIVEE